MDDCFGMFAGIQTSNAATRRKREQADEEEEKVWSLCLDCHNLEVTVASTLCVICVVNSFCAISISPRSFLRVCLFLPLFASHTVPRIEKQTR